MSDLPVAPGEILAGKYRVERLLGEGGHGVVVAAQHLALGERVAIKLLRPDVAKGEEAVARFLREARASVRIKGEHVARVLDVGATPAGMPYMVMEHLDGNDLSTIVETSGALPIAVAVDYALQTCEALAEAHGLGIVHRDIKPSNLFLTTRPDGSPCIKVLDFGISKATIAAEGQEPALDLTQTQTVLGSPQYMAPEQMRSSKRVDGRTDIWAIGTTLHELITGRAPFEATTLPELFAMILQDPAPRLTEQRPEVSAELEAVVARCLEKDPERRFANVQELARALAPMASSATGVVERISRVGVNAARSSTPSERLQAMDSSAPGIDLSRTQQTGSPFKKTRSVFLVAGVAASIAIVGGAGIFFGVRDTRTRPSASTDLAQTASLPPSTSPVPPPAPLTASAEAHATPEASGASTDAPATSAATTIAGKKRDPRSRPPESSKAPAPARATSHVPSTPPVPGPPPPATAPTEPPRAPGVASSRYD